MIDLFYSEEAKEKWVLMKPAELLAYLDNIRADPFANVDFVNYYEGPIAEIVQYHMDTQQPCFDIFKTPE